MNSRYQTLILTAALLSAAGPAAAIDIIFLELKDTEGMVIKGEAAIVQHKDKIVIESFSLGVSTTAGIVTFNGLRLTKLIDKTSPLLYLHCAQGSRLQEATLIVIKMGQTPVDFYTIKLTDVLVSSVQTAGSADGGPPTEVFMLTAVKIEFSYNNFDSAGRIVSVTTSRLDFSKNVPIP